MMHDTQGGPLTMDAWLSSSEKMATAPEGAPAASAAGTALLAA